MIHDSKAEALEARGLYRRAAARWAEVIMLANDDKAREQAAKRRAECIRKAARPPARQDNFGEMRETISRHMPGWDYISPMVRHSGNTLDRKIAVSDGGRDFSRLFCASKKPAARSVAGFVFQVIEVNGKNAIIMRYCFMNCNDVDRYFSLCNHNHCFVQEI